MNRMIHPASDPARCPLQARILCPPFLLINRVRDRLLRPPGEGTNQVTIGDASPTDQGALKMFHDGIIPVEIPKFLESQIRGIEIGQGAGLVALPPLDHPKDVDRDHGALTGAETSKMIAHGTRGRSRSKCLQATVTVKKEV